MKALRRQLRTWAVEMQAPVVVDVRRFDRILFVATLQGSVPDNGEWVRRKGNVVAQFHCSSYGFGLKLEQDGVTLESRYGLGFADYAAHGGSFPLLVRGVGPIGSGTVTASRLAADPTIFSQKFHQRRRVQHRRIEPDRHSS